MEAIKESCHGPRACFAVADGGEMGSVIRSCNAPSACEFVAEDGEVATLTDACNAEYACDKGTTFVSGTTEAPVPAPTEPPSTVAPTHAPVAAIHTEALVPAPTEPPVVATKPKPVVDVPKAEASSKKKKAPPTASPTAMPTRTSLRAGTGSETHTTDDPQIKRLNGDTILSFMETVVLPYLPIVVGVFAGIALILFLGMLYKRRRSKNRISKNDDDDTQSGDQSVESVSGLVKLAQDEKTEVTEETKEMSVRAEEDNIGAPPKETAGKSGWLAGRFGRAADVLRGVSFWRREGQEEREFNGGPSMKEEKKTEQTDQSVASVDYDYSKYYVKVQKDETKQTSGGDAVETGTAVVVSDDGSVVHEFIEAYPLPNELDGDGDQSVTSVEYDYSKYYVSVKDRK